MEKRVVARKEKRTFVEMEDKGAADRIFWFPSTDPAWICPWKPNNQSVVLQESAWSTQKQDEAG